MAIHETKKQSDLEKRLRLLRQQIYGNEKVSRVGRVPMVSHGEYKTTDTFDTPKPLGTPQASDITYLYHDLTKIGILASIALGIQLILFFLMKNQIFNLKF